MIFTRLLIGLTVPILLTGSVLAANSQAAGPAQNDLDAAVRALLFDPDAGHRQQAATLLGDLADERGVEALIRALEQDPVPAIRAAAAWALGQIGSPDAYTPLRRAANNDPEQVVRGAAQRALYLYDERARAANAPIERTVIEPRPYVTPEIDVWTGAPDYYEPLGGIIIAGGSKVVGVPTYGTHRDGLAGAGRERQRQLLPHSAGGGRPQKRYAGDLGRKPSLHPAFGGRPPLRLLRGTGNARSFSGRSPGSSAHRSSTVTRPRSTGTIGHVSSGGPHSARVSIAGPNRGVARGGR